MDATTATNLTGYDDLHVGIFDLDGLFRHKLVDAKKAAKLIDKGYSFCDVIHAWDSAEMQWEDDRTYIDRPARVYPETIRHWPFGPRAGVASSHLAELPDCAPVPIFLQRSPHFRPPQDPQTPMIMEDISDP